MPANETFHTCPCCGQEFTVQDFLGQHELEVIGLRLDEQRANWNFYFFNHLAPGCFTTFTVPASRFDPYLGEPIPDAIMAGDEECGSHCLTLADHAACENVCHWAPYRRFLQVLLGRRSAARR